MNYIKPEIAVLGDAIRVIQFVGKSGTPPESTSDQTDKPIVPAYDLDE